jgi:hypothetical protein
VIYTVIGNDEAKFKNGDNLKVDHYASLILLRKIIGLWKLLPILRTTISLFLIDYNHSYDDVNTC